jgi:hypothetical protein
MNRFQIPESAAEPRPVVKIAANLANTREHPRNTVHAASVAPLSRSLRAPGAWACIGLALAAEFF